MSNTPAIPEEIRQSIKDYSAGRSPRATVQADCIFGYSLAQKEISTLEKTIQEYDKQILELKEENRSLRIACDKWADDYDELKGEIENKNIQL